jgi:hypothetical protein
VTVHADGQHPGQQHARDDQRRRRTKRHARWPYRTAPVSLPRSRQRALNKIEQALAAEDSRLELRFAVFTRLTRHEAMPETEQVPDPFPRFLQRAILLPLLTISLAAMLAASWLMTSRPTCPADPRGGAHTQASLSRGAHFQPGPAIRLNTMPVH